MFYHAINRGETDTVQALFDAAPDNDTKRTCFIKKLRMGAIA